MNIELILTIAILFLLGGLFTFYVFNDAILKKKKNERIIKKALKNLTGKYYHDRI